MKTILALSIFCTGCYDYAALSAGNVDVVEVDGGGQADAGQLRRPVFAMLEIDDMGQPRADLAGTDGGLPEAHPASCFDVLATTDGAYTLYVAGNQAKPWGAWCKDMATDTPKDYLDLQHIAVNENFSQYTAGGTSPGSNVRTVYKKVRIDPATLIVDTSDQTFATSTGLLMQGGNDPVTSMPFAVAMDCSSGQTGRANIDLRGTPFTSSDAVFIAGGFMPNSKITNVNANQTFDLQGGGGCGWFAGGIYNSSNGGSPYNGAGGFRLQLVY